MPNTADTAYKTLPYDLYSPMKNFYQNTSIRRKIIVLLTAIFVLSASLGYLVLTGIIAPSFAVIEEQEAIRQTEQVVNAINDEIAKIDTMCHDWATWDDSYNFILNQNLAYVANIQDGTLIHAGINLLVYFDSNGRVVYQKGLDLESGHSKSFVEFSQPQLARDTFEKITTFGNGALAAAKVAGIYRSSEGLFLLSCRPVLTSNSEGPVHGYLVMAKQYTVEVTDQLHKRIKVNFTTSENRILDSEGGLTKAPHPGRLIFVDQRDRHLLHALTEIMGIDKKHALTIKISMSRQISEQGTNAIRLAIWAILLIGAFTLALLLFFFHQLIAGPLDWLVSQIGTISDEMDFTSRLALGKDCRHDEIGILASRFNDLLEAIEFSNDQLEDVNSQQEEEIARRKKLEADLRVSHEKLRHQASHDELTGIANRRFFDLELERQWHLARREQRPLALVICDVDYFKLYNDTYGHPVGDSCLQQVASCLAKVLQRPVDLAARYGGEEFVALLPETLGEGALVVAEKIRQEILALAIPHSASSVAPYVTISLGVASLVPSGEMTFEDLVKMADVALYKAKEQGRNKVVLAG